MHLADAAKARSALADKANPNTCSLDRRVTPLLAATIENEMQLVKLLLDAGADPNGLTCKGIAPLFIAVGHNNLELMKLLLSFGANVEAGRHEMTPLQAAAMSGDVDMVDVLLQHKVSPNVVCEGWSALTLASNPTEVTAGHVAVVDLLLRAGADPNLAPRDSDVGHGCNALFQAVGQWRVLPPGPAEQQLRLQIVQRLVKAGSPVNERCAGRTPLDIARLLGEADIAAFLLAEGAEATSFSDPTKSPEG